MADLARINLLPTHCCQSATSSQHRSCPLVESRRRHNARDELHRSEVGRCAMNSLVSRYIVFCSVLTFSAPALAVASPPPISFNQQIQPLLSEYCYPCHGPDSASRKPKKHPMRLDREQFAFEPRIDGQPVIIRGAPDKSELV